VEFRVLGPLDVVVDGTALDLGGAKPRRVLAALVLRANQVVSTDSIIDAVWQDEPPDSAVSIVRTYVSRLRRVLAGTPSVSLAGRPPGYVLETDPERIDAHRFEHLAVTGRGQLDAGDPATSAQTLTRALRLWRGRALADMAELAWLQPVIARLDELRLVAIEDRIQAELALGRHAELVGELHELTAQHRYRERLWRHLIVALYRAERQADAVAAYQTVRTALVELGIEPGPELRSLEQEVLTQADALRWRARPDRSEPLPLQAAVARTAGGRSLVGRKAERAVLARCVETARAGTFNAVFIAGPPGIGKTAHLTQVARDAHETGMTVLLGRADEGADCPFAPIAEALDHWVAHAGAAALDRLEAADAEQLRLVVPALGPRRDEPAPVALVADATHRRRLFEAIGRMVQALSAAAPALIVLDDLHWADPATLQVLQHLLRHPPDAPALVIGTYRDTDVDTGHQLSSVLTAGYGDVHVERVELCGLADTDVEDLLRAESGTELDASGRALARHLAQTTAGNPLFIHETLRHLTERGAIAPAAARWTADEPWRAFGVPSAVTDLIEQRLRRLPPATVEVLRHASVVGQDVDVAVLSRAMEVPAIDLLERLEPALAAQVVTVDRQQPDRVAFPHALVRDAISEGVPLAQRVRTHWRAGEAIAAAARAAATPDECLGEVARHLAAGVRAGDPRAAVAASIRAGAQALATLAFEDARARFVTAIELIDRTGIDDPELQYDAWAGLGEAGGALDRTDEHRDSCLRAAAIARRQRWPERLGRAAIAFVAFSGLRAGWRAKDAPVATELLDEALTLLADTSSPVRATVLAIKVVHDVAMGRLEHADERVETATGLARQLGDPTALAVAHLARCWTLLGTPRADELREAAERAVVIAGNAEVPILLRNLLCPFLLVPPLQLGDRAGFEAMRARVAAGLEAADGHADINNFLRTWDRAIDLCSGRFDEVIRAISQIPDTLDWPGLQALAAWHGGIAAVEQGTAAASGVRAFVSASLEVAPDLIALRAAFAAFLAQQGDHREAAAQVEVVRATRPLDQLGLLAPPVLRSLAEVAARLDDEQLAADLLPVAEPFSGQLLTTGIPATIDAAADRVIGQLLLALGRLDAAVARLTAAHELERSFGADALATRTAYWRALTLLRRDRPGDALAAQALVEQASADASRLGMVPLHRELATLAP
jgi:DNA-binding SARP family transcriptional activator